MSEDERIIFTKLIKEYNKHDLRFDHYLKISNNKLMIIEWRNNYWGYHIVLLEELESK